MLLIQILLFNKIYYLTEQNTIFICFLILSIWSQIGKIEFVKEQKEYKKKFKDKKV